MRAFLINSLPSSGYNSTFTALVETQGESPFGAYRLEVNSPFN